MKKLLSLLLAATMTVGFCACGDEKNADSSAESAKAEIVKAEPTSPEFGKYVSNTVVATGNNKMIDKADNVTYRAYLPVEKYGEFEYCFYYSNTVDSTWGNGRSIVAGRQGGNFTIESASVGSGTAPEKEPESMTAVTFDGGSASKNVTPGETFWTDPVNLSIEEGSYLVWEWTITGTEIPCNCMSDLTPTYSSVNGTFVYANELPLPIMFGCDREVDMNVAVIGDSITQGCETTPGEYKFWASQIQEKLSDNYSLWNLGLGYARTADAAEKGDWLTRATNADVVLVAFGTNDIASGRSIDVGPSSAEEVEGWARTIVETLTNAGCKVVLFTAPPFDYDEAKEAVRQAYNTAVPTIAEEYGAEHFDFAACLSDPANPSAALYGGHPNDEGCEVVAEKFMEEFAGIFEVK